MITAILLSLFSARFFYLIFSHQILYYVNGRLVWFLIIGWTILLISAIRVLIRREKNEMHLVYVLLILLIVLPVRALDPVHSLAIKISNNTNETNKSLPADTSNYSYSDWFDYLNSGKPQPELEGNAVSISGFLDGYDSEHKIMDLGRLVITCCIADAYKTSIPVQLTSVSTQDLLSGEWYFITGHWHQNSKGTWVVVADSIKSADVPPDPYVYP